MHPKRTKSNSTPRNTNRQKEGERAASSTSANRKAVAHGLVVVTAAVAIALGARVAAPSAFEQVAAWFVGVARANGNSVYELTEPVDFLRGRPAPPMLTEAEVESGVADRIEQAEIAAAASRSAMAEVSAAADDVGSSAGPGARAGRPGHRIAHPGELSAGLPTD